MITDHTNAILTIDPGNCTGWAYFAENRLLACGTWDLDRKRLPYQFAGKKLLVEDQVIYPRSPVPPGDILALAKTAARAAERLGWERCEWVPPRRWKGNVNADIMLIRIIQALTDTEKAVYFRDTDGVAVGYRHNMIDAIGIGLWKLKRLPR